MDLNLLNNACKADCNYALLVPVNTLCSYYVRCDKAHKTNEVDHVHTHRNLSLAKKKYYLKNIIDY